MKPSIHARPFRGARAAFGMFVAFAVMSGGITGAVADPIGFRDVSDTSPHANNIYVLAETGVAVGYPDGTFRPYDHVTRGQVATMVVNGFELTAAEGGERFSDVAGTTHADGIGVLASRGVVEGFGDGTFRPNTPVTRAQVASILGRVLEVEEVAEGPFPDVPTGATHSGSINALYEREIVAGRADGTFRPAEPTQRDQFASLLRRAMR